MPVVQNTCTEPVCPTNCTAQMPPVLFDLCAPETNFGQIARLFTTNFGNPLINVDDPVEWQTRLALLDTDPTKIWEWSIIGSKAAPTANAVNFSRGRVAYGAKDHSIAIKVDETNQINYDAMRAFECGGQVLAWYETYGGLMYGGNDGIPGTIVLNDIIPEDTNALITFEGTFSWKAKFHPCRSKSVVAAGNVA